MNCGNCLNKIDIVKDLTVGNILGVNYLGGTKKGKGSVEKHGQAENQEGQSTEKEEFEKKKEQHAGTRQPAKSVIPIIFFNFSEINY